MSEEKTIDVIVEISMNSDPVKYEYDKGVLRVDRFMQTSMRYPCNYGFIPNSLGGDSDPLDALLIANWPIVPSAHVMARPIGVLMMEDDSGQDEKIIAVPSAKIDSSFGKIQNIEDIDILLRKRISNFFEHYKDLEPGKWVKIYDFEPVEKAIEIINQAKQDYINSKNNG